MDLKNLPQNNFMDSFEKPDNFLSKLDNLKQQLPSILEDFKKYYIFYNKNPDYSEYRQIFENIKNNMQKTTSNLLQIGNEINRNTTILNKQLITLNTKISHEKNKNDKYKKIYGSLKTETKASDELVHNYVDIYNKYYNDNFVLAFGIIFIVATSYRIYLTSYKK